MTSRAILLGWPLIPPSKALSAPAFSVQAAISGSFIVGNVLIGSYTVTGFPAPNVITRWTRDGVTISGATGNTYTVTAADVNHEIGYHVFISNGVGSGQRSIASGVAQDSGSIPAGFTRSTLYSAPLTYLGAAVYDNLPSTTPSVRTL